MDRFEDLDREATGRESYDHAAEVQEWGEFSEDGGTLILSDFEDARAL